MTAIIYELPRFLHFHRIIDFNKLSYKKLKRLYAVVITITMLLILAGVLFPALRADDYTDGLANDFTDTTMEGTIGQSQNLAFNTTEYIGDYVTEDFAPGMTQFFRIFGVDFGSNIIVQNFFTEPMQTGSDNVILDVVLIFGVISFVVATTLFILGIIRSAIVAPYENVESPRIILFKFIKALILIMLAQQLLEPILLISQQIFGMMSSSGDFKMGGIVIDFILSVGGAVANPILAVKLIVQLILWYIILKEFVKLNVEVIERYLMSCFLYLFAPVGFSFSASSLTEKVTTNYLTMYVSSLFMLILNQFFIKTTLILMSQSVALTNGEIGYFHPLTATFVLLAWMRIGQHIDENLNRMGLSVARTGGNLFDSAVGAGLALMSSFGKAKSFAGGAAGSVLNAKGMAESDPFKVQKAAKLQGKPITLSQAEDNIMNSDFDAAKNLPVRDAQVANMFDGAGNSTADRQFALRPGDYMNKGFGAGWEEKIAGAGGHVDANSLKKASGGIITGEGTDKDGNKFDFSLANSGKGLRNSVPFADTVTNGTPWNVQYGKGGGLSSINSSEKFIGQTGVKNFMQRAGISSSEFSSLTGYNPSDITSISMSNGSARFNTANGTAGALHSVGGAYRFSNTSVAPAFGTKGKDRSSELTAGKAALQKSRVDDTLSTMGISKPSAPEGANWKHESDFYNHDTGVTNAGYTTLSPGEAYFDNESGKVYVQSISASDENDALLANPVFTEASQAEAESFIDAYNKNVDEFKGEEMLTATNEGDGEEIDQETFDNYAAEYSKYYDAYNQTESAIIGSENEYIRDELMNLENLLSVDEIDANEKIIHATSKERGPVTYSYRVVFDQGPSGNEKVIGGTGGGHNMIAFKEVRNRKIDK